MKILLRPTGLLLILTLYGVACSAAEDGASLESARFYDSTSLIQHFLLVADKSSLRYALTGGGEKGIQSVELFSSDKVINHLECYGAKECRISGATPIAELKSKIVTAVVRDTENREQREKVMLNLEGGGTKVYMISSIPNPMGGAPVTIAGAGTSSPESGEEAEKTDNPGINKEITTPPEKGPSLSIQVKKNGENDYSLNIVSIDESGVNFIEILENGKFFDVQICDDKKACSYEKNLKKRPPGRNKYLIKSMNANGALSFQEELILFTE